MGTVVAPPAIVIDSRAVGEVVLCEGRGRQQCAARAGYFQQTVAERGWAQHRYLHREVGPVTGVAARAERAGLRPGDHSSRRAAAPDRQASCRQLLDVLEIGVVGFDTSRLSPRRSPVAFRAGRAGRPPCAAAAGPDSMSMCGDGSSAAAASACSIAGSTPAPTCPRGAPAPARASCTRIRWPRLHLTGLCASNRAQLAQVHTGAAHRRTLTPALGEYHMRLPSPPSRWGDPTSLELAQ
jgi:hypothetical protein